MQPSISIKFLVLIYNYFMIAMSISEEIRQKLNFKG